MPMSIAIETRIRVGKTNASPDPGCARIQSQTWKSKSPPQKSERTRKTFVLIGAASGLRIPKPELFDSNYSLIRVDGWRRQGSRCPDPSQTLDLPHPAGARRR